MKLSKSVERMVSQLESDSAWIETLLFCTSACSCFISVTRCGCCHHQGATFCILCHRGGDLGDEIHFGTVAHQAHSPPINAETNHLDLFTFQTNVLLKTDYILTLIKLLSRL